MPTITSKTSIVVNAQNLAQAQQYLKQNLPAALRAHPPSLEELRPGTVVLRQAMHTGLAQNNGQLCCSTFTALTCFVMQLAHLDVPELAVQTCNTSLANKPSGDSITIHGSTLRRGRSLIFGEVKAYDEHMQLLAHSTCTFSL
ncbi:PaaI family thioesterase [Alcaligenes endophyticus]|uniref:PaaI family thioesterase n=1 Tax=Alcaligenes endophyticus TaxID=1929088 RepID=A0ABT8EN29_9BURK|nr:hypothetical protein [Alcaligenes endophyticus]MCX5591397.1 hypothetical protein [Alcaligenes endophyticus]MDN4122722.1 hypothetical protein [Alcaligenes endophyticus]